MPETADQAPVAAARPSWSAEAGTWLLGSVLALVVWALAIRADALIRLMKSNADYAAPLVLAERAHQYADAQIVTGRLGWYEGLWFLQLIRPLPDFIGVWLPFLVLLVLVAALALQARVLWNTNGGLVLAIVAFATGPAVWAAQLSWSARATTWWAMALTGLAIVLAAEEPGRGRSGVLRAAAVSLAVLQTALTLAGDPLAIAAVLVPLAAVGGAAVAFSRWRLAGLAGGMIAASVAGAALASSFAAHRGVLRQSQELRFIPTADLQKSVGNLTDALVQLWEGPRAFGAELDPGALAGVVAGLAGIVLVILVLGAAAWRLWTARGPLTTTGVWWLFWGVAAVGLCASFVLTTVAQGGVARYLYGLPLVVAALAAPLAAVGGRMALVVRGLAVVLGVAGAIGILARTLPPNSELQRDQAHAVAAIAKAQGITRGYAGYWNAYPLEVLGGRQLEVTPLGACRFEDPYRLCAMYLHYIDRAYASRPGSSLLVVDTSSAAAAQYAPAAVTQLPSNMRPTGQFPVEGGLVVYTFDHDIAADVLPNKGVNDPRVGQGGPLEPQRNR